MLQGVNDRKINILSCYRVEMNVDKTTIPARVYDKSKKTEECGIFQAFGLLGVIFTRDIESRISVAKAGFDKKKAVFASNFYLKFKE